MSTKFNHDRSYSGDTKRAPKAGSGTYDGCVYSDVKSKNLRDVATGKLPEPDLGPVRETVWPEEKVRDNSTEKRWS